MTDEELIDRMGRAFFETAILEVDPISRRVRSWDDPLLGKAFWIEGARAALKIVREAQNKSPAPRQPKPA